MPIVRLPAAGFLPRRSHLPVPVLIFCPGGKVECTIYAPLLHELAWTVCFILIYKTGKFCALWQRTAQKTRNPQQAEPGREVNHRGFSKMATQRFIEASNSSSLLFWNKIRLSLCCGSARFCGIAKLHRRRYSSQ